MSFLFFEAKKVISRNVEISIAKLSCESFEEGNGKKEETGFCHGCLTEWSIITLL
jgi:hypothetical protein